MSHSRFGTKRPGYLASSVSFGDNTDVGLLTINHFKKDAGCVLESQEAHAHSSLSRVRTCSWAMSGFAPRREHLYQEAAL
eukprot:3703357-Amphidinium_carterae.1